MSSSTTYATSALPKRALLIGLNYPKTPSARLQGCIADIVCIRNVLIDAYGYMPDNIAMLRDDDNTKMPTRQAILNALNTLALQSATSSEIWIHYSGHGTQVADRDGDEPDRQDEVLVPSDFTTSGFITDDMLFDIFKQFKCRVLFFSDSCHSGSIVDLQYSINYVNGTFTKSVSSNKVIANPNIIVMSGCRDAQTSADTYSSVDAQYCGAFTTSFITMLRKNNHTSDIMKIYGDACSYLINNGYSQIPVLSSTISTPSYSFSRAGSPVQVIVQVPVAVPATSTTVSSNTQPVKPATSTAVSSNTQPVKPATTVSPVKISMVSLMAKPPSMTGTIYVTKPPTKKGVNTAHTKTTLNQHMSSVLLSTVRL